MYEVVIRNATTRLKNHSDSLKTVTVPSLQCITLSWTASLAFGLCVKGKEPGFSTNYSLLKVLIVLELPQNVFDFRCQLGIILYSSCENLIKMFIRQFGFQ